MTDPAHQLYGLTLLLLRVEVQERVGRVCVVRLRPDVERRIPLVATSLSGIASPPSPARLSVAAVTALLAVVAAIPVLAASLYKEDDGMSGEQEGRDGATRATGATAPAQSPARATPGVAGAGVLSAAAAGGDREPPAGLGQSGAGRAAAAPPAPPSDCAGGGA